MENKHIQQVDFSNPNADKITSGTTVKQMETKQTAVDWLVEQIQNGKIEIIYSDKIHSIKCIPTIVQQAKEMEKEQIEDAFQCGKWDWSEHITKGTESKDLAQYYNKTYGK